MRNKFIFSCISLCLLSANSNAKDIIANLGESLNITQVQKCEQKYKSICPISESENNLEGISNQSLCMESKMKLDNSCKAAYIIRQHYGTSASEIRSFSKGIVVYTINFLADGQTGFFIVDNIGRIFMLTSDNKLISSNLKYQWLNKKYPNLALTPFVSWSQSYGNDGFPTMQETNDGTVRLIFNQEIRDNPCVACERIAIARVAYVFNKNGVLSSTKILAIESALK